MSKKRFIILCLIVVLFLSYNFTLITLNKQDKLVIQKKASFKSSGYWILNSIIIDNTGGGDYTWAEAAAEDWCSGTGTWSDPFVIENVTINANNTGSALLIRNSDVYFRIENCTLYNSGPLWGDAGISLDNAKKGYLVRNKCSFNNENGIYVSYSSHNTTIESNIMNNNTAYGLHIFFSNESSIISNHVNYNGRGLRIYDCINHLVLNNNFTFNIEYGIHMDNYINFTIVKQNNCSNNGLEGINVGRGYNNTITQNTVDKNYYGIYLSDSLNQTIKNNNISGNTEYGILSHGSNYNTFSNNKVRNNTLNGLDFRDTCNHNSIYDNEIYNNQGYGFFIYPTCNYNLIYANYFYDNNVNAFDSGGNNEWDNGILGNYWDDYDGLDSNGDGIGDSPYLIPGGSGAQDNSPIVKLYEVPGVEGYVPLNQTIKVGLLADFNDITGEHAWKGASLAAKEINEAGGILINGSIFYIGLTSKNTYEYEANLNITKGVNAANNLISNYNPDFIIGGTVYDAVSAYLEPIMDAQIPFINLNTGGYTNLTQNVQDNYPRYKYLFQLSQDDIGSDVITFQLYLMGYLNGFLSRPINKIALIYEERYMTKIYAEIIKDLYPTYGYDIIKEIIFDSSTTKTEFENYWKEIDNAGTQFAYVFGHSSNIKLISQAYGEIKPRCLVMNTFRNSTMDTYWEDTNGKCEYEINVRATYNISRTARTIPFWNEFVSVYGHEPTWWSIGFYDSIYIIENATLDSQSLNPSNIVNSLEKINVSNTYPTICGTLAFTSSHAPYNALGFASMIMCQWRSDGTKVVIPNNNLIYYDSLATGGLQTPDWGINVRFTINSPNENNAFADLSPAFNIEILDTVDKIWYTLNSGSEKYSITSNATIDQTAWMALSDGVVKITFYANETSGEIYRRYVHVIKDTEAPQVTIEPMETTTFGSEAPTITLNIQDASNITESYYSLDGGVTKIPFTGNVVTINQTLWDELGEGTVTISFYIIDSVGKETVVYLEVYKDVPGVEDYLLYIIIGVIALALGVVSTIVYTQHRRKKKRRTEWVKLKKKKGLISPELAEGKNLIFISYATKDSDLFQIPLITDILVQYPEIDDILYWESDMHDDIYEYMDDNLKLCSVFLLFCTQTSLYSEPVKMEWRSALKLDKKIVPIFINPNDIPPLLTTKLGVQFNESEVYNSIEEIYQMILKKLEIDSTREFCRYLIPKMVSDEYFEEQVAPMVKKDIEIESDNAIEDLKIQFISILEKNNFEFLKKPIDTEEIEKPESQLISLRFFAEDKFERQEIGLTATIQKFEDYKNKIYLRVMGNREWMVNEILRDLGNKLYPLKTVTELLREYSEKIENFIDHIDNLEEFLRKNLSGSDIEEIEEIMYQYLGKQIEKDDFIKKGLQVLGKRFILVFIENLTKISHEKEELEDQGKEIDI